MMLKSTDIIDGVAICVNNVTYELTECGLYYRSKDDTGAPDNQEQVVEADLSPGMVCVLQKMMAFAWTLQPGEATK